MRYIAEKYGKTHAFIGNADTRILLSGTPEEIRAEVKRCMDIGKSGPGFVLAVGNHIPANKICIRDSDGNARQFFKHALTPAL